MLTLIGIIATYGPRSLALPSGTLQLKMRSPRLVTLPLTMFFDYLLIRRLFSL